MLPESSIVEEIKAGLNNPIKIELLEEKFSQELFWEEDYVTAYRQIEEQLEEMPPAGPIFKKLENAWGFKKVEEVKITMTLYGMGGSYHDIENRISFRVKKDGVINLQSITRIIFHEAVHIGIEEKIVRQLELTQDEKETVVDAICLAYLPAYCVQKRSIAALLQRLPIEQIEGDLPRAIVDFKRKSNRPSSRRGVRWSGIRASG